MQEFQIGGTGLAGFLAPLFDENSGPNPGIFLTTRGEEIAPLILSGNKLYFAGLMPSALPTALTCARCSSVALVNSAAPPGTMT